MILLIELHDGLLYAKVNHNATKYLVTDGCVQVLCQTQISENRHFFVWKSYRGVHQARVIQVVGDGLVMHALVAVQRRNNWRSYYDRSEVS